MNSINALPHLTSPWLRPALVGILLCVHGAGFAMMGYARPTPDSPPHGIEIALISQPEQTPSEPESVPEPVPVEEPQPLPAALLDDIPAPPEPDSSIPLAPVTAQPKPRQIKTLPRPAKTPPRPRIQRQLASTGAKPGKTASTQPSGISTAAYRSVVVSQIQSNKFYPAHARSAGITGTVGVAFIIGPSGRVSSASVSASSGVGALDSAALRIVRSIAPPPPPGGVFRGNINLRFNLGS